MPRGGLPLAGSIREKITNLITWVLHNIESTSSVSIVVPTVLCILPSAAATRVLDSRGGHEIRLQVTNSRRAFPTEQRPAVNIIFQYTLCRMNFIVLEKSQSQSCSRQHTYRTHHHTLRPSKTQEHVEPSTHGVTCDRWAPTCMTDNRTNVNTDGL